MKWYVKAVTVIGSLNLALERTLATHTAKYPIRRVEVKSLHIDAGRRDAPENSLFNGQIPRRLIIACVEADAFDGVHRKSPFNFQNFGIKEISVTAAGEIFPSQPLTMDFSMNLYAKAYTQLFEGLGIGQENKGNGITPTMFKYGSCIFAIDLSPDEDDGNHFDLIREGATTINIHFASVVPVPGIEVICYAEYDNLLEIDHNRNVYIDYRT
jgi:hypothetical protein